jgi:hypothetical protein
MVERDAIIWLYAKADRLYSMRDKLRALNHYDAASDVHAAAMKCLAAIAEVAQVRVERHAEVH